MESSHSIDDHQQTTPSMPINNSSSRRKQSKPNRLEHVAVDNPTSAGVPGDGSASPSILSSITPYHIAAEQQDEDATVDRTSLNCEDGSLSSHSTGEHYAMEDIINRSRDSTEEPTRSNGRSIDADENLRRRTSEDNEREMDDDQQRIIAGALDFSFKIDEANQRLFNSSYRSRSINASNKSRSLKRKHPNAGNADHEETLAIPNRIFHADAFCAICRKEFCNKYFLKTHLANKHGIFDHQSSVSTASVPSLVASTKETNDLNHSHAFTIVSTLLDHGHENGLSPSASQSSDLPFNCTEDQETELKSLEHQMNAVIDDDLDEPMNDRRNHSERNNDDDNDDEQDGTNSNLLNYLPQARTRILSNGQRRSLPKIGEPGDNHHDDDDDDGDADPLAITANSPTNSLEFQQQSTGSITAANSASRQSSAKLLEDFCDICQKRFCNKYYLRKHKLDVHGVQTDGNIKSYKRIETSSHSSKTSPSSTSNQLTPSSMQLSASFANVPFNAASVQQSLGMLLNPIFSPLVQSSSATDQKYLSTSKRRYTDSSTESLASKPSFSTSILNMTSDVANVLANQLATANNHSASKSSISTCYLCGKKFQSNDYLQLHLMNKHQIKSDLKNFDLQRRPPSARPTKVTNAMKSSNGSSHRQSLKNVKLESIETNIAVSSPSPSPSPLPSPSSIVPGIVDTYFAAKMADRVSCDICHKQVCNKYFLKTHKLKVHGVAPESSTHGSIASNPNETDENDQQQQSLSFVDSSPPRLLVDEINLEPGAIPSPDALTASVHSFITNNNDTTEQQSSRVLCNLCSKAFASKFLLHIHMTNVHGIQQTPSLVNGSSTKVTQHNASNTSSPTKRSVNHGHSTVRLKQTPQVQLRVTCQVCKKELCNKYFLRAHMRNVHNITVDDLRLIPSSTSSHATTAGLSPRTDPSSFLFSSSNAPSPTSTIPADQHPHSIRRSLSNDNDSSQFNGHLTDSNESESVPQLSSTAITTTTTTTTTTINDNNNNDRLLSMQPFLVESDDDLYKDLFVPCMVYLPCRHRVTKPLEVSLRLKPVDNPSVTSTPAMD